MTGTVGLTNFLVMPLFAIGGMAIVGAGTMFAPGLLLMLPFLLARAG